MKITSLKLKLVFVDVLLLFTGFLMLSIFLWASSIKLALKSNNSEVNRGS
jgi:hypothetical protein